MDRDADGDAVYLSTVWTGSCWTASGTVLSACWVLSLTPSTEYPSAFGAIRGTSQTRAVHGTWTPQTCSLQLVAIDMDDPSYSCTYEAALRTEEDGSYSLQGHFREGSTHGRFVLRAEPEDANVHISGLWIGQASPDASLEAFAIPTNPIRWSLALVADGSAFGAGYFDDSGDVPGRPLLFYVLQGARSGQDVQLIKKYEMAAGAGVVPYKGQVLLDKTTNEYQLSGDWKNDDAGSFGQFRCTLEGAASFLAHASCCNVCQAVLRPPELSFEDIESSQPWRCCVKCHANGAGGKRALVQEEVLAAKAATGNSCAEIVESALSTFTTRPFIGIRSPQNGFQWLTYAAVGAVASRVAVAMRQLGVRPDDRVVLIGRLSPSYVAAMLATLLAGCTIVPLDLALESTTLARCLSLSGAVAVFAESDLCAHLTEAIKSSTIKQPCFTAQFFADSFPQLATTTPPNSLPSATSSTFSLTLEHLTHMGTLSASACTRPVRQPTDLVALLFTSGSTGEPKAAAYSERLTRPSTGTSNVLPLVKLDIQKFHPSFLISLLSVMQVGGRRAIVDDLGRVLQIAAAVRPTHISAPPAFWLLLQREYAARVAQLCAMHPTRPRGELEADAAKFIRLSLGNRLVVAASGGALLAASTLEFIRNTIRIQLSDLYGSRETGGIACNGQVYPGVDVRLLPLEDSSNGTTPVARGEIAVHSSRLIEGYFSDSKASGAAFVELDGKRFYRTGDVGEFRGGKLFVLDRCGAMQKLTQSEWLAPSKVEAILEGCPWASQVLLVVPSSRTHVVAVVVPTRLAVQELSRLAENERASAMLKHLQLWANHLRLRPHEVPKAVIIEPNAWTVETGLLTPTLKKRRAPLVARYTAACEAAAASMQDDPAVKSVAAFSAPFTELLSRCGVSLGQVRADATLAELGVDSLTCARLAALMHDAGVRVASSQSVHLYQLSHWDALYTAAMQGAVLPDRIAASEAIDWAAECKLPATFAQRKCATERGDESAVLLTGATGFLGPYLLHEILSRTTASRLVYALVRAPTNAEAERRCKEALATAGLWNENNFTRVRVLAGDLAKERFSLPDATWTELCTSVGDIFHSGARVDVTLPYAALKASNVGSTLTAIDLTLSSGARLHYISSASALSSSTPSEEWLSVSPSELAAKSGYGATKAVSELLLREAATTCGLNVRNFRYSAICGDEHSHNWNTRDFSYLLFSAAAVLGVMPHPARALLHWVPVEWAARATVVLALQPTTCNKSFNLVGHGPSVSEVADAMRENGVDVKRCTQAEWRETLPRLPPQHQAQPLVAELRAMDFASANDHNIPTSATKAALTQALVPWFTITPTLLKSCSMAVQMKKE